MLSLDEQLDTKVLEMFDALEELYKVQENLEQVMRDGFFNLSRARYSMGMKRVSADQIVEAEMQASRTVLVSESEEISSEPITSLKTLSDTQDSVSGTHGDDLSSSCVFTLHKALSLTEVSSKVIPHKQEDIDSGSGVRKRNLKDFDKLSLNDKDSDESRTKDKEEKSMENKTASRGEDSEQKDESKPKKAFNPLNLFGVLVPRELRTSQSRFEEAVGLVVQVSNLQQQLQTLEAQYKKLKRMKA